MAGVPPVAPPVLVEPGEPGDPIEPVVLLVPIELVEPDALAPPIDFAGFFILALVPEVELMGDDAAEPMLVSAAAASPLAPRAMAQSAVVIAVRFKVRLREW